MDPREDRDPLTRYRQPLLAVAIATIVSLLIAAMIGGNMPLDYEGRAWTYTGLVMYVLIGAAVVFSRAAEGERQPLSLARLSKWTMSLWVWPLLVLWRRR